jgi:uncharacterized membrane protein (UPF0182 family)
LANAPDDNSSSTPQFQLTSPMLVNNAQNLAGYISADSDPDNYGQLTVLVVSDKGAVQGPGQVANTFRTKSEIAANIRLLNGGGTESSVIHGNLLTLPLGDSFLYVEPLYAASTYPTLQRVLVSYGNNLGYGATLQDALSDFLPGHHLGQTLGITEGSGAGASGSGSGTSSAPPSSPAPSKSASSSPPSTGSSASVDQLLTQLDQAVNDRNAAYDSHDADRIAAAEAKVQKIADQLVRARASAAPSAKASPSK